MEININVDELKFKEILQEELNAFTKDELKEICREGLVKCMSNAETFKDLFSTESQGYCNRGDRVANELIKEAAKSIDLTPCYEELKEKAISYIKENNEKLIKDIFTEVIINGIEQTFFYNPNFKNAVASIFREEMAIRNSNGQLY